jgi:hypothetical protein
VLCIGGSLWLCSLAVDRLRVNPYAQVYDNLVKLTGSTVGDTNVHKQFNACVARVKKDRDAWDTLNAGGAMGGGCRCRRKGAAAPFGPVKCGGQSFVFSGVANVAAKG